MAEPPILSWEGLGLIQGSGWLFQDIDLHIGPRDRLETAWEELGRGSAHGVRARGGIGAGVS